MKRTLLFVMLCVACQPSVMRTQQPEARALPEAHSAADTAAVLGVVQRFFDAMAARDTAEWAQVLTPEGRWYGYTNSPDGFSMFTRTNREAIDGLGRSNDTIVERMWDATVLLHDRMAVVWTPYDLYINDVFSHCGIDAFTLLKVDDGWRIASVVFSRQPQGCAPSPLGPLR
ncbi:MAG TPA: nuclear transport factor 2 family protein [Burkholderiales bacterium]|nr:nuclear transport factor 2 family protein [Burkholderiales bacterium]